MRSRSKQRRVRVAHITSLHLFPTEADQRRVHPLLLSAQFKSAGETEAAVVARCSFATAALVLSDRRAPRWDLPVALMLSVGAGNLILRLAGL